VIKLYQLSKFVSTGLIHASEIDKKLLLWYNFTANIQYSIFNIQFLCHQKKEKISLKCNVQNASTPIILLAKIRRR